MYHADIGPLIAGKPLQTDDSGLRVVRDEEGHGVAGAKVQLTFELESVERPGQMEMAYGSAESDTEGRWSFGGAPDKPTKEERHG